MQAVDCARITSRDPKRISQTRPQFKHLQVLDMAAISERRMLISALLAITMPVAAGAQAVPVQDPIAGRVGWQGLGGC